MTEERILLKYLIYPTLQYGLNKQPKKYYFDIM